MSSGGAISSMVTSIRNNRRERKSKLDRLKNTSNHRIEFIDHKNASPELLRKIRTTLQFENQKRNKIAVIKTSLALIIICIAIYIINVNWTTIATAIE